MDVYTIIFGIVCLVFEAIIFAYFFNLNKKLNRIVGTLRIDSSDPDGPYMFLELSEPVSSILNEEYVTLKVNKKSYISPK